MRKICLLALVALTACEKEIDFDYHEVDPIVVIEGRVTNEGMEVVLTKSRSVNDSVPAAGLDGARVVVATDDETVELSFDEATGTYRSPQTAVPGKTYRLTVDFEGTRYTATSVMQEPSLILNTEFTWQKVLDDQLLAYQVTATDPDSLQRNYFWYRLDRQSSRPDLADVDLSKPYRWNVFDDRGNPPGLILRDIMCMSKRIADENKKDDRKSILYEGDTLVLQWMTIDAAAFDYFRSLNSGQNSGANPRTNIAGGCLGYFLAGYVTRTAPVVFR